MTGMKVTPAEYEDIQNIYLNAGDMDKESFCRDYKKHASSAIMMEYYKQSETLRAKLDKARDERREMVDWLIKTAHSEGCAALRTKACNMSSVSYVVMRTLQMDLILAEEDVEWLKDHLADMHSGHNPAARF